MSEATRGVILPSGETGSSFFHRILAGAVERFPDALAAARLPSDAARFKSDYAKSLVRFESARVASPARVDIARHMVAVMHDGLSFGGPDERRAPAPLAEHLAAPAPRSVTFTRHVFGGKPGLVPAVVFGKGPSGGKRHEGRAVLGVTDELHRQHHMSDAASAALRWVVERAQASSGSINLTGQRFALIGAGAELAPTAQLLQAGATVLWLDVVPPDGRLPPGLAGELVVPDMRGDVLDDPRGVAQAITQFAEGGPVHLGLFAYAPGKGRELRLAAAMDAIVRSLAPDSIASVAMYVSPTVPAEVQPEDVAHAAYRAGHLPLWQRVLQETRALKTPGHEDCGGAAIAHAIVGLQGATYQAAQYLAKLATAEVYATQGVRLDGAPRPIATSANIAGITATRSLVHPLFQAGFIGAPLFNVRIFEPGATRTLAALLVLHDILNVTGPRPATPAEVARALNARQLHGGVNNLPWTLETTIRTAAVIGLTRKPSLAMALARRS